MPDENATELAALSAPIADSSASHVGEPSSRE